MVHTKLIRQLKGSMGGISPRALRSLASQMSFGGRVIKKTDIFENLDAEKSLMLNHNKHKYWSDRLVCN